MIFTATHGRILAMVLMAATLMTSGARAESPLQGTWLAESAKEAGVDMPEIIGHRLSFDGDRFRITKDGKLLYGGTFTVDPSANPSSIMFDQNETQSLAGVWRGIYALTGDTLTICDNAPGHIHAAAHRLRRVHRPWLRSDPVQTFGVRV